MTDIITPASWITISEVADLVEDSETNIQDFIRHDKIPYVVADDGILIWWGGFQTLMPELYDLGSDLLHFE